MKKILLTLLILAFSIQICLAEETTMEDIDSYFNEEPEQTTQINGYLQYNDPTQEIEKDAIPLNSAGTTHINFTEPKKFGSKSLISNSKKPTFHPMEDELEKASKFSAQEYDIRPVSQSFSQSIGNFTFGTSYGSSLSNAQASYSTGIFTKYNAKHYSLSTVYSKSTNNSYDDYNNTISFIPELKLTKRLSLLDVMKTDTNQINKSNEIVLRYKPHLKKYADEVELEVGAGQSFYEDNYVNSAVRFSTRFKL